MAFEITERGTDWFERWEQHGGTLTAEPVDDPGKLVLVPFVTGMDEPDAVAVDMLAELRADPSLMYDIGQVWLARSFARSGRGGD